jgi:hypothetical protein
MNGLQYWPAPEVAELASTRAGAGTSSGPRPRPRRRVRTRTWSSDHPRRLGSWPSRRAGSAGRRRRCSRPPY